ncbi:MULTISPECIES: alpha/beta fold hydrolase [Rhodanobacter]|jgi:pimeloyl-ACP methyl ester carboxylesterase|uniref:Lysophospholipase, alpha-beta hydrolase superfamily n=1 Tax=Rhodanobacter glycinis TaxID=582702 RepID=A0A1I4D881_9GAMM|nr:MULTISPECIES: alpha/beta hydrolase [Rhodanobacter]EIL98341.1 alpha/beta hydrolase fold domain-containing protein [Rhodanobacter sp. 115]SFK89030.1 Lysophospholipase, alpha-beta hydrolase superfamily [Rhodanobacter glycinis]
MEKTRPQAEPFRTGDGIALAVESLNPAGSPTLLFAHGFGQTRGAWGGSAAALARQGCHCVTFDTRGHGESERSPDGSYHMQQFAEDLLRLARAQSQPPILIGASMGGLLGLVVAGETRPAPFRAMVLVDITPRWETAGVERILAFMQAHPDGFADYAEAATQIATYLPQRNGRKSEQQLRPLMREAADGRLHWHWDPALLAGGLVQESERYQPRLLSAAAKVDVPVLLLSGERSDVVSRDTVDEFLQLVPHARHVEVAGATHMVAGDANDAFTREIAGFIHTLDDADARRGVRVS